MNNPHAKENETGEKLYGMPLEDILTPEQLLDLQKQRRESVRNKPGRRNRKQKKSFYIKIFERITSFFNDKRYGRAIGILCAVLLILIFLKPITPYIAPKSYVSEALEETLSRFNKETHDAVERIFGFDILSEKNLGAVAKANVQEDSLGKLLGVEAEADVSISKKQNEAVGDIFIAKNGEDIISAKGYLTDYEAGVNFPQFFGEYWISPVSDFGKRWNGSGFQKTLYANEINENSDISFSNVFCESELFEDNSEKQLKKIVNNIISSSEAKYAGKKTVQVNGKDVKAKNFAFSFEPENLQTNLIALINVFLKDSMMQKRFDVSLYSDMLKKIENLSLRFANSISFDKNINLYFSEYKGVIVDIGAEADYIENLHNSKIQASVKFGDTKNITDFVSVSVDVADVNGGYSLSFSSEGNHSGKNKMFSDKTVVDIVSKGYSKKFSSFVDLDFKSGDAKGDIFCKYGVNGYSAQYSGKLEKNNGIYLSLDSVKADIIAEDGVRTLSGNAGISVVKNRKLKKHSATSKKYVLDMEKEEAEAYLTRVTDSDVFKDAYKTLKDVFGK